MSDGRCSCSWNSDHYAYEMSAVSSAADANVGVKMMPRGRVAHIGRMVRSRAHSRVSDWQAMVAAVEGGDVLEWEAGTSRNRARVPGREGSATSLEQNSHHQTKMYLTIGQSHVFAVLSISSHNHHHPTGVKVRQPEGQRDETPSALRPAERP